METFNAIMKALIFIVMTGAAAIAMSGDYDHLVQTIMEYSE